MLNHEKLNRKKLAEYYGTVCVRREIHLTRSGRDPASKLLREDIQQRNQAQSALRTAAVERLKSLPRDQQKQINGEYRDQHAAGITDLDYGDWLHQRLG